jgi:tRNA-dihydrouridine synthase
MNFWQVIKKPILGLSPMDGITDAAFRYTMAITAKPDVIFTEFINVDGMMFGDGKVFRPLMYSEVERPIVGQIFGVDPAYFYKAAKILCEFGFDGIDINMGCPSKSVSGRGAGAGLIRTPELAKEIFSATEKGVADWKTGGLTDFTEKQMKKILLFKEKLISNRVVLGKNNLSEIPVSLKTRIGYDTNIVEKWISTLMELHPANISLHGRLLKQMYTGKADWDAIALAADIVHAKQKVDKPTSILGNGDIKSMLEIPELIEKYRVDGVLVGRGTLGNPWFFEKNYDKDRQQFEPFKEIVHKIVQQLEYYDKVFGEVGFVSQRKHMCWYIKGFENASDIRSELVIAKDLNEVKKILKKSLDKINDY